MPKLTINLPEGTAATIEIKPVIVMSPTDRDGYLGFLDACENVHVGLEASMQVLTGLKGLEGLTADAAEGIEVLSDITRHPVAFEAALQAFFAPDVAISHLNGKDETLQRRNQPRYNSPG
jgi:hypothetical protein